MQRCTHFGVSGVNREQCLLFNEICEGCRLITLRCNMDRVDMLGRCEVGICTFLHEKLYKLDVPMISSEMDSSERFVSHYAPFLASMLKVPLLAHY
jgi:hypothetical protein